MKNLNTLKMPSMYSVLLNGRNLIATFSLLVSCLLNILNTTRRHDTSSENVAVKFLPFSKTKYVEGIFSVFEFFIVINRCNSCFSLRYIDIIIDIIAEEAFGTKTTRTDAITIRLKELIEDVV